MQQVQKYSPMQGSSRFTTTSFPIVKTFRLDASAMSDGNTTTTYTFKKGSIILGFMGKVTTAFVGVTSELSIGFTGQSQLSLSTTTSLLDAVGDVIGPASSNTAGPYVLTADDTFDAISTSGAFTAGKMDVHVTYVPPPDGDAPSTFKQYNLT